MADLLVTADYRGQFSHGMNRLEMYLNDIQTGTTDGAAVPTTIKVSDYIIVAEVSPHLNNFNEISISIV